MRDHYESYAYIDLATLDDPPRDEGESADAADAATSCAGKVLLMFTRRGMELVRVPSVVN